MAKLVDAQDLKSWAFWRAGSSPALGTIELHACARDCLISLMLAGSLPAERITRTASSTSCTLVLLAPNGASSRPTRTWPPRSTAYAINGVMLTSRQIGRAHV